MRHHNNSLRVRIKKPNRFVWHSIGAFISAYFRLIKRFRVDKSKYTRPNTNYVVVCNHTSFTDPFYLSVAMYPHRHNFMASRRFFFEKNLWIIMRIMRCFPKSLFDSDIDAIKKLILHAKAGHNIAIFPEGQISPTGVTQECNGGMGRLIKHIDLPVVAVTVYGGALANPPWGLPKRGPVIAKVNNLLDRRQISTMTADQIDQTVREGIFVDNSQFALTLKKGYKGKNFAQGLEKIVYVCPHCLESNCIDYAGGHILQCRQCQATITIDDRMYAHFDNHKFTLQALFAQQRQIMRDRITQDNLVLRDDCTLNILDADGNHSTYEGAVSVNGEHVEFVSPQYSLRLSSYCHKGAPSDLGVNFQMYDRKVYYEFCPHSHTSKQHFVDYLEVNYALHNNDDSLCNNG